MSKQTRDTIENIAAFFVALAIVVFLLYCVLFWGSLSERKQEKLTSQAIENYKLKTTKENASIVLKSYKDCLELEHSWSCRNLLVDEELITKLTDAGDIDEFINAQVEEVGFESVLYIWKSYKGKTGFGLIKKSEALTRSGKYQDAFTSFKLAFDSGDKLEVAVRVQKLFQHFGCTDEIAIWSELTDPKDNYEGPTIVPSGTKYPDQPAHLSQDEIISKRIELRRGKFFEPSEYCPIARLY